MTAPGSRALDAPAMSAERRALEKARQALRRIANDSGFGAHNRMRQIARSVLAEIIVLVPDAGGDDA